MYLIYVFIKMSIEDLTISELNPEQISVCSGVRERILSLQAENPKESINIAAHNEEDFITQTLSSVANFETEYPLEIMVVNNASTDRTRAILEACGVKIVDEQRKGISYAREAGWKEARGEIIVQIDADATAPSLWLNEHLKNYDDDACVGVTGPVSLNGIHPIFKIYGLLSYYFHKVFDPDYFEHKVCAGTNLSYRKKAAEGCFNPGIDDKEDFAFKIKLAQRGKVLTQLGNHKLLVTASGRRFSTLKKVFAYIWHRHLKPGHKPLILDYDVIVKEFADSFRDFREA